MPTLPNHEHRITALEDRVGEIECSHGETLYKLDRRTVKHGILLRQIADQFNIREVTDEDVDEALDQE